MISKLNSAVKINDLFNKHRIDKQAFKIWKEYKVKTFAVQYLAKLLNEQVLVRKETMMKKIYEFALIRRMHEGYEVLIRNEAEKENEIKKLNR